MKKSFFYKKNILITGGTGSFGSSFLTNILKENFSEVRIFSRDEKKQDDLRNKLNNKKIKFYIGDTRNFESINEACKDVDYIFHAAALKQVPSCEFYPMEAINTNILGTKNVIESAISNKVKKLVLLSTDKAVYPINAMGLSKALAEKILVAKSKNLKIDETLLCITRYGNVMNSRGSVIPRFVEQIKSGENVTITNPQMTRYIMSLKESIELVKYAMINGSQGDTFVQKSPATTILELAEALKKIYNKNNKIQIIGIRHGEKKHETLISSEEMSRTVSEGKYYRIKADNRDINYEKYFIKGNKNFKDFKEYNSHNTKRLNQKQLIQVLKKLGQAEVNV
jgi:UDP-glucose 4-epimerase